MALFTWVSNYLGHPQAQSWGILRVPLDGEPPVLPPSPPPWYQGFVNLLTTLTPENVAILIGIGAVIAGSWYALSQFYESHGLEVDAGEAAGSAAYASRHHRKKEKERRR